MPAKVWVGCSGWSYKSWKPAFYPQKTPATKLLNAYAERLNSVEVNYTFRSSVTKPLAQRWLAQAPAPFRFAFKAPQSITHLRRLRGAEPLARAFATSLQPFDDAGQLGPVLFQLPPNCKLDPELLETFLQGIQDTRIRTSWEFRHSSWFTDAVYAVLRKHHAVLCAAESDALVSPDVPTVPDLRVFRLRRTVYTSAELATLAGRFASLAAGGADVFAFFKHEETPEGPLRAAEVLRQIPQALRG